jgi:hypothetical protein
MPMNSRRALYVLTTAIGGTFAAMSLTTATATADYTQVTIGSAGSPELLSESGMPPFNQSFLEQGSFSITLSNSEGGSYSTGLDGQLSTTESFGVINQDLVSTGDSADGYPVHSVFDITNFGGGFENYYTDLAGLGPNGAGDISDTFYTPFGHFDIPVTFDAAALPAAATDWTAALDADWTTLVTDFSALF